MRKQFYADDGAGVGKLHNVRKWWSELVKIGSGYGYYPNAHKTVLVVKPGLLQHATDLFNGAGVVSKLGQRYLGSYIGHADGKTQFLHDKNVEFIGIVNKLSKVAEMEPHAAYSSFTVSVERKWS